MWSFVIVAIAVIFPMTVDAAVFEQESLVSVSQSVAEDLYAGGRRVVLGKPINGDVWFGTQEFRATERVDGDITGAGQDVTITGVVTDDVRVVGSHVVIDGVVKGDLVTVADTLRVRDGAHIEGEAIFAAKRAVLNGEIDKGVNGRGSNISLAGTVGPSQITAHTFSLSGKVEGALTAVSTRQPEVGESAFVTGDVRYWGSSRESDIQEYTEGSVTFDPELRDTINGWDALWQIDWQWIQWSWAAFTILVLMMVISPLFVRAGHMLRPEHWPEHRYGAAFGMVVGIPVLAFLFAISVLGLPIALLLASIYVLGYVFIWPVSSLVLAFWVNDQGNLGLNKPVLFVVALFFYTLLRGLTFVSGLEWVPWLVFFVILAVLGLTFVPRLVLPEDDRGEGDS